MTWSTRWAAVCDIRRAPHDGQVPRRLRLLRQLLVVAALAAPQPQEPLSEDAALEEGFELVLDESRALGAGAGLSVGEETGRMLLHQAVRRGLLGAVTFVVERSVIRRPLGRPAYSSHDALP